jgi:hypothetical protein
VGEIPEIAKGLVFGEVEEGGVGEMAGTGGDGGGGVRMRGRGCVLDGVRFNWGDFAVIRCGRWRGQTGIRCGSQTRIRWRAHTGIRCGGDTGIRRRGSTGRVLGTGYVRESGHGEEEDGGDSRHRWKMLKL